MLFMTLFVLTLIQNSSSQLHRNSGCSNLQNAYGTFCTREFDEGTAVAAQGPPGKRGPIGLKGDRGFPGADGKPGPPAVIDYDEIEATIQRRVQEALRGITNRVQTIEDREGYCPVKYNGSCFWMEVRHSGITCIEAQQICESLGGHPANIYSEQHYLMMKRYMRTLIDSSTTSWLQAYLGLKYNANTNQVSLSDGTAAPYVIWYPGYPYKKANYPCMGVETEIILHAGRQDMFNDPTSTKRRGVLCEK